MGCSHHWFPGPHPFFTVMTSEARLVVGFTASLPSRVNPPPHPILTLARAFPLGLRVESFTPRSRTPLEGWGFVLIPLPPFVGEKPRLVLDAKCLVIQTSSNFFVILMSSSFERTYLKANAIEFFRAPTYKCTESFWKAA